MNNTTWVLPALARVNAVITDSHLVYTSGKHGSAYVNKDAIYPHTSLTSRFCAEIAWNFRDDGVEVVVAPAIGAVILSQWVAHHLSEKTGREILGVYAEHEERPVIKADSDSVVFYDSAHNPLALPKGCELMIRSPGFIIKRGYGKIVAGRRVLVVEDILTTGGSVKRVIEATRALGGDVVGLGVLCNRGGVNVKDVADPPRLSALVNINLEAYPEETCPLCASKVPINIEVGKGKDFLARQQAAQ